MSGDDEPRAWDADAEQQLRDLWGDRRYTVSAISDLMGIRKYRLASKAHRMGLGSRSLPRGIFIHGRRISPKTEFSKARLGHLPQPYWNAEWLRTEYVEKGRSAQNIAEQFGVCASAVDRWRRQHGIPRQPKDQTAFIAGGRSTRFKPGATTSVPQPYWDREWLYREFVYHARPAHEIARECEVSVGPIYAWLSRHGIETPGKRYRAAQKSCSRCHRQLPNKHFRSRSKKRADGSTIEYLNATCRRCDRELAQEYADANRETKRARTRDYMRRRQRRMVAGPGITSDEIIRILAGQKFRCWWCKKRITEASFHLDHRIPIARGGEHGPGNVVASCAWCNHSKGAKMPWQFAAGRLL